MFNITFKLELTAMLIVVSLALASLSHAASIQTTRHDRSPSVIQCHTDLECESLYPQLNK